MILAGPALYLAGHSCFSLTLSGRIPWSRITGVGALACLAPLALVAEPLLLASAAALVTLTLAFATGAPSGGAPESSP